MESPITWMPVFIVVEAQRTINASISSDNKCEQTNVTVDGCDFWQRIGTAIAREDGGFTIHLNALPTKGEIVVRPPQRGECLDPTSKNE